MRVCQRPAWNASRRFSGTCNCARSLLNAEYPAPPAVANAYIKDNPAVLASKKQHGCVISQIADEHAKYSTFRPKGGPYNTEMIEAYVVVFASTCPVK